MSVQASSAATVLPPGLVIRPLEPRDGELLRGLFGRLSPESRYLRFFSPVQRPEQTRPEQLLAVDHRDREALAALAQGELLAVARYTVTSPGRAEIAVVVADEWQHRGLGSLLLQRLAALAAQRGISKLQGVALGENQRVVGLVRKVFPGAGFTFRDGLIQLDIPVTAVYGAGS